jgi:hypothetical protein
LGFEFSAPSPHDAFGSDGARTPLRGSLSTRRFVMTKIVAHCLCRSFEVLIVIGVLHLALSIEAWALV